MQIATRTRRRTNDGATTGADYTARLQRLEGARWKRLLDVQAPYRWNVRRLDLGRTLDVGCGIGRNLAHLDGQGVGVDHNAASVELARSRGLVAYTPVDFRASDDAKPASYDSLLLAHVVEHMPETDSVELVREYLDYVRPSGRVVFMTPQERGYASDSTHVRWMGFAELEALADALDLTVLRRYSFPLPRWAGKAFLYNEFNLVAQR